MSKDDFVDSSVSVSDPLTINGRLGYIRKMQQRHSNDTDNRAEYSMDGNWTLGS